MKYQVGYQDNRQFIDYLLRHIQDVSEVYFPWGNFTTGRGVILSDNTRNNLAADLRSFSAAGVKLCLLLNGNCYGHRALSRKFFQQLGDTVDHLSGEYAVSGVTTASPLIARFLRRNFPDLELRASVNMEIGTPEGIEYVEDYFDSFYLKREYNYDLEKIVQMRDFCRKRGKKLYILANSGCLNNCSAHIFHDNLVAHEAEISAMDNGYQFRGVCWDFLSGEGNREKWLQRTNFIRPEDIELYENIVPAVKLATRVNSAPSRVLEAYVGKKYRGSVMELLEPNHSGIFYPNYIENANFDGDFASHVMSCRKNCEECSFCADVMKRACVKLADDPSAKV